MIHAPAPTPAVSVLLPFHNAASTLPAALRSLRGQTLREFEVVAVDDGSTDGGDEVVRAHARHDPRFHLVQQPHRGHVAALNAGLERCRGALVARMDADDISLRPRLAEQRRLLQERPELEVVSCLVRSFPFSRVGPGMALYEQWLNSARTPAELERDLLVESPLCHPSVMLRAHTLRRAGGYREGMFPEDYELWLRLSRAGVAMAKVPRLLFLWRDSAERLTRTSPQFGRDRFFALKLDHLLRRWPGRELLVWGAGKHGKPWLRAAAEAAALLPLVVDVDPRKIGQWIHGCRVIPPEDLPPPSAERLLLVAVGAPGARGQIRAHLAGRGYRELAHFVCVA